MSYQDRLQEHEEHDLGGAESVEHTANKDHSAKVEITKRQWWDQMTPSYIVPRTSQRSEYMACARYYRTGMYNTNNPDMPLHREVLKAIKDRCGIYYFKQPNQQWCLDYVVITDRELAKRVLQVILKHRPKYRPDNFYMEKRRLLEDTGFGKHGVIGD